MTDNIISPARRFVEEQYFKTLLILFAAIIIVFSHESPSVPSYFRMLLPWLLFGLIFSRERTIRIVLLTAISTILATCVAIGYFSIANHGFILTYVALSLLIAVSSKDVNEDSIRTSSFWLLALLMGIALIQKLLSPYYMSGNLMADFVLTGIIQTNLLAVSVPDWQSVLEQNVAARAELSNAIPPISNSIAVVIPPVIGVLAWILTYASILLQFLIEVALIMRRRWGLWVHYLVLAFVFIVFISVKEFVFLSANCFLGYALTDEKTKSVRMWYVLFVFYFLSLKLTV